MDASGAEDKEGFDLGPSWFRPQMQPAMGRLVAELGLPAERLHFSTPVTGLSLTPEGVGITAGANWLAQRVILALPPRLVAGLRLDPAPEPADLSRWQGTATWMEPHAKVFGLYDRPFWREAGFSGTAQSIVGPLA